MAHDYPVMLDIADKPCLIVGGGRVAERKAGSLLRSGARITVLSPQFTAGLEQLGTSGRVELRRKHFAAADLQLSVPESAADGVTAPGCRAGAEGQYALVIAATDSADVNEQVQRESAARGLLINVADRPDRSSFIVPSVVRRGKLLIAVSTGGASPSAARRIAAELEQAYGDEFEQYIDFLMEMRLKVRERVKDIETRRLMFQRMLEWDVPGRIRDGSFAAWSASLNAAWDKEPALATIEAYIRQRK